MISNLAITKSTSVLVTVSFNECFFWMRSEDSNNTSFILSGRVTFNDDENDFSEVSISDPIGNGDKQYLALSTKTIPAI